MYQLNYLSIILILIAFFIFYNEFNKKLSIADMCLLTIAFIAILRASYNYIQIDNSLKLNSKNNNEGFVNKRKKSKSKRIHSNDNDDNDDTNYITLNSEESNEYLDSDNDNNNYNNNNNDNNLINSDAVNNIDALLGIGIHNKEMFSDITEESKDDIKSIFTPKIVIGKNDNLLENPDRWNNVFSGNEFNGNRNRNRNRNNDDDDYSNRGGNGSGNGSGNRGGNRGSNGNSCDGGSGVGNGVSNGNSYDSISSDEDIATYTDKKRCGKYDDIRENEDGSIIVQNYSDAKTWNPGYTYLPPSNWDVPQKRAPVCSAPSPNTIKLTGLVDRGLPLNVLELHPHDGKIAKTEDSVKLTNVGSMLPKFKYEEQPFSKPYI